MLIEYWPKYLWNKVLTAFNIGTQRMTESGRPIIPAILNTA